jgi:hypothetical protein
MHACGAGSATSISTGSVIASQLSYDCYQEIARALRLEGAAVAA